MKKTLLFAAAMAVSCFANAQFFVGGEFNFTSGTNNTRLFDGDKFDGSEMDDGASSFYFAPYVGTAIGEDWEVGVGIGIGTEVEKEKDYFTGEIENTKACLLGLGAYARRYFSLGERLSWYVDAGVEFDRSLSEAGAGYVKGHDMSLYMNPGFYFDINDHWGLDIAINYLCLSWDHEWQSDLDNDKKICADGGYSQELNFGASTNFGSIHDFATDGVTLSVCYNF